MSGIFENKEMMYRIKSRIYFYGPIASDGICESYLTETENEIVYDTYADALEEVNKLKEHEAYILWATSFAYLYQQSYSSYTAEHWLEPV